MGEDYYMNLDGNNVVHFDLGQAVMIQKGGWTLKELFGEERQGPTEKRIKFTTHKLGVRGKFARADLYTDR